MLIPEERLKTEMNIWLATTRPDGRPHLVPVWFIWHRQEIHILTASSSVKAHNLAANPRASVALENGNLPVIAECIAYPIEPPYSLELSAEFKEKYDWDITRDDEYNAMFALKPVKFLVWTA